MSIFERFPTLTTAVFLSTLGVDLVQSSGHGVLEDLQRTPAGLHGGWWRTGTALFAVAAVGLTAAENIHGPALLLGGIFAVLLSVKVHQPGDV
ncbi:hypothetical protein [Streptomyces sp. RKAG337]|uniref:hypothetical protein n=1 Tax=Streptomyces sp. RKAG337 TaxID=2893404 RepID=UPI00203449EE|nr:hypothetical protein [Streptomyces sp. RKAG337]MCM2424975.1 hypothetical protein [Streptomyces sp. RKAG337]